MRTRSRSLFAVLCVSGALSCAAVASGADTPDGVLATDPAYHALDFWLGDWEVFTSGANQRDGHDRVERLLKGAAIMEHWNDADGSEGKSWFYYQRAEKCWKQVWVTDGGGVKEKFQVAARADGGVRFRGRATRLDGTQVMDQTTLTPLPDGTVRQVIETSRDEGKTWRTVYDAVYTHGAKP